LLKSSAGFLAGVGVMAVVAHKFWPKGVMYGDKEDWEKEVAKKIRKKRHEAEEVIRDRLPGARGGEDDNEDVAIRRRRAISSLDVPSHGRSVSRHRRRSVLVHPPLDDHDRYYLDDGDDGDIVRGGDLDAWRGWERGDKEPLSSYDEASLRREMREEARARQRLADAGYPPWDEREYFDRAPAPPPPPPPPPPPFPPPSVAASSVRRRNSIGGGGALRPARRNRHADECTCQTHSFCRVHDGPGFADDVYTY
jgi:hypothetical protein